MTRRGKTIALGVALIFVFVLIRVFAEIVSEFIIIGCVVWSMCSLATYLIDRFVPEPER